MGLDNFAYKRTEIDVDKFKNIDVLTGMMAGGATIRGKFYAPLVEELTGHSMYDELGEPQVEEIAASLGQFAKDFKKAVEDKNKMDGRLIEEVSENEEGKEVKYMVYSCGEDGYKYTLDDIIHVAAWFKVVADEEGHIVAWF